MLFSCVCATRYEVAPGSLVYGGVVYVLRVIRLVKMAMTSLGRPVEMGLLQSLGSA